MSIHLAVKVKELEKRIAELERRTAVVPSAPAEDQEQEQRKRQSVH
jgi:hypothetical protein